MKRFILIAVLVGALAALLAGTAFAAGPVTPPTQGFGPGMGMRGMGMHAPGAEALPSGASGMMRRGAPEWAGDSEAAEKLLDMTEEQIHTERLAGKSLAQIAASKNISEDELISAMLEAKKADLAQLVVDGKLTQAQMDAMVQNMQTQIKTMVERTNIGPAFAQGQTQPNMGRGQAQPGGMMGQSFRGGRGANR